MNVNDAKVGVMDAKMANDLKEAMYVKEAMDVKVKEYIESLTDIERKAMEIAEEHLETSFHVVKSIGFQQWLKK